MGVHYLLLFPKFESLFLMQLGVQGAQVEFQSTSATLNIDAGIEAFSKQTEVRLRPFLFSNGIIELCAVVELRVIFSHMTCGAT